MDVAVQQIDSAPPPDLITGPVSISTVDMVPVYAREAHHHILSGNLFKDVVLSPGARAKFYYG